MFRSMVVFNCLLRCCAAANNAMESLRSLMFNQNTFTVGARERGRKRGSREERGVTHYLLSVNGKICFSPFSTKMFGTYPN